MNKQEIQERIKDIEERLDVLKEELNKADEIDDTRWKPKNRMKCCYFDKDSEKTDWMYFDEDDEYNFTRLENNVIFKTEQEAEEYKEYYLAKKKAINEFSREECENEDYRYYFYYDYADKYIRTYFTRIVRYFNIPYFRTKQDAIDFAKKYKKFICKELGYKEDEITIEEE